MDNRKFAMTTLCLAALLAAGCAEDRYREEEGFGDAVRAAKARQIINPDASRNAARPDGMDGASAKATIDRYQKSYESPPPPVNVFTIGVGGGTAGSSVAR